MKLGPDNIAVFLVIMSFTALLIRALSYAYSMPKDPFKRRNIENRCFKFSFAGFLCGLPVAIIAAGLTDGLPWALWPSSICLALLGGLIALSLPLDR